MWQRPNLSQQAEECLHDLFRFLTEYWKLDLREHPHREMCRVIQDSEVDPTKRFAMLVVPRSTYKTSIGRGAVVWKQLRQIFLHGNVYHRIVLASATLPLGETSLRSIEGQLRYNKKLIADYGELWINDRQNEQSSRHPEGMVLAPRVKDGELAAIAEPSFWVGSLRRISTGFHADGALVDDLNNYENVSTDHQRMKTLEYWRLLFPIIEPKDRGGKPSTIQFNSTPWHDADVRGTILREESEQAMHRPEYVSPWVVLHRSAYNEDGSAFFPEKLSIEVLDGLRERMGPTQFSSNYLCDPVGENGFVHEEEIQFIPREKFPPLHTIRATIDPSQHTKAKALGCYAAIVVGGYDRFANLYIKDARGSRTWDTGDFISALFQLEDEYPDLPMLIEDKHMAHFDHAIRLEEAVRSSGEKRRHLRIQYVPTFVESKYQKWMKLQPRFKMRRVFFAEEIDPKLKAEIREELVRGSAARFKDFLDAIAMQENGIRPKVAKDGSQVDQSEKLSAKNTNGVPTFAAAVPELSRFFKR